MIKRAIADRLYTRSSYLYYLSTSDLLIYQRFAYLLASNLYTSVLFIY